VSELIIWAATAHADRFDEFVEYLRTALPDTRAFDGCEGVTVHRDLDEPNRIVMVERWASREHYVKYVEWRSTRGSLIKQFQSEPSSFRRFADLEI
jgi:quinol monooxygenase YgiN